MSQVTLNQTIVEMVRKAQETLLVTSMALIKDIPSKDKLDDSKEKAFYVRMVRNIHNACEALDGESYRNASEIENKSAAYKAAKVAVTKLVTTK